MTRILDITNLIVNYKISVWDVVKMLIYAMPFFLEFVIPMSVMMAVLLTFLRMSSDNEIIAIKTAGISIYGLLPPVLVFCFIGSLLTAYMAICGLPWGRLSLKALAYEVAQAHIDIGLKERTFNDTFENVMLYVNKIDLKSKTLIDIFIEDQRTANIVSTVVAPRGRLYSEADKLTFHLQLYNGIINRVDLEGKTVHTVQFDRYDIGLDLKKAMATATSGAKDEEEMTLAELRHYIKNASQRDDQYYLTLMEWHKKFSIPIACFALGLLAVALGVQSRSSKRSYGIGLGLVFFLLYYIILSAGWVFGEAGLYPPLIGMWAPNIIIGALGYFLLSRGALQWR